MLDERAEETLSLPALNPTALRVKRLIDIVLACAALVLTLPIWLVIAALVKATSRGPVFYRQQRVGKDGRVFSVLKFRSMQVGTDDLVRLDQDLWRFYEANDFKLPESDPRITRIGRWIRKSSLDELPQLVNVLRGEMSLVGIRPIEPEQLAQRSEIDRKFYCLMRPGITGSWQVLSRNRSGRIDREGLDRHYITHWTLRQDLRILLTTPKAALGPVLRKSQ